MKRKISALFLAISMLTASTPPLQAETLVIDGQAVAYNQPAISLYVNHKKVETTQMNPVIVDNRVLVPIREVFEAMKAQVTWNGTKKTVTVVHGKTVVVLEVNKKEAYVDGKLKMMDVPPKVINGKVMIPIRFVSEALGMSVLWDSKVRAVYITEPVKPSIPSPAPNPNPVPNPTPGQGSDDQIVDTGHTYSDGKNSHQLTILKADYSQTKIINVALKETEGKLIATLTASSAISDAAISLLPGRIIIDVKNSISGLSSSITPVSNTYVRSIRTSQFTNDTARIVLDLHSGALVQASLSSDRTKLNLTLSRQKLEALELKTASQKDHVILRGLSSHQIKLSKDEVNKRVTFKIDHMLISKSIDWNPLNSEVIKRLTVTNSGDQILGTAYLKEWADAQLIDDSEGVKIVFSKQVINGGNQDNSTSKPEDNGTIGTPGKPGTDSSTPSVKQGLTYTAGSNKPMLQLNVASGLKVSQLKITDDYRNRKLVFDLGKDYRSILPDQTQTIGDKFVKSIAVATNGTTKITVNTASVYNYYVNENQNGLLIQLVKPSEKFNKIVVIDIGHGGRDAGAVANNVKEKDANFDQGMALYRLLEADPTIKVYMTRETDVYPTLQFRAELANDIGADLFVSLHNNSAAPNIVGTETLYYPSATDQRGKQIAQIVQKAIVSNCNMNDRGIKARSDLYVLKNTNMPAILIETGFLSNASEAAKISSPSFISVWAKAVYRAIVQGFELL